MKRTASLLAVLLMLSSACGLPRVAPRLLVERPRAATPIEVCWLELGGREAPAGLGAAGAVQADAWHVTTSALLVRHPKGVLLVDTGLSDDLHRDADELHGWARFVFDHTAGTNERRASLPELLERLGVQPTMVVLSHAHPDHAGGVPLLGEVPVWLPQEELDFAARNVDHGPAVIPSQARALVAHGHAIPFEDRAFSVYARSWDVFGDGSVVVVPTFGHTPGSVSTFVDLGDRRLFHVGDLISLRESVAREVPKGWLMRELTDEDIAKTDEAVARLVDLQRQAPDVWILPAHDRAAWEAVFGALEPGSARVPCVRTGE